MLIPKYFEKRFDRKTRIVALILILVYMIGYVGINFYTLGVALQPILNLNLNGFFNTNLNLDLYAIAVVIAIISAIYMHAGGQTSVMNGPSELKDAQLQELGIEIDD